MPPQAEVHPCWRIGPDEICGPPRIDAAPCEHRRNTTCQRLVRIRFTVENGNGNEVEQHPPRSPCRQLQEIVRADQPYEIAVSVPFQPFNRIHGILCADLLFQVRDTDFRMAGGDGPRRGHARRQIRHTGSGFQGILRRNQPPDLIQAKPPNGFQADRPVPLMGGIERPPKQTDPGAPGGVDL